jgi:hypothetical protein
MPNIPEVRRTLPADNRPVRFEVRVGMDHGRIVLDNSVDQFTLLAHAADADAILDVTDLDLRRLPPNVRASLYSAAAVFQAPSLCAAFDIEANRAASFLAPELRTAGNINATHAELFEIPELRAAGHIHAASAAFISLSLSLILPRRLYRRGPLIQHKGAVLFFAILRDGGAV